jgi:hypothetical protein
MPSVADPQRTPHWHATATPVLTTRPAPFRVTVFSGHAGRHRMKQSPAGLCLLPSTLPHQDINAAPRRSTPVRPPGPGPAHNGLVSTWRVLALSGSDGLGAVTCRPRARPGSAQIVDRSHATQYESLTRPSPWARPGAGWERVARGRPDGLGPAPSLARRPCPLPPSPP